MDTDNQEIASSFHYRDGIYFERQQDGTVLITKLSAGSPPDITLSIDKDSWPSIVAAVGKNAGREHADDYHAACEIHEARSKRP
jgi:hypothetical protein